MNPIVDCEDIEAIRHIKSNECLIVSKEELMRGVDYRTLPKKEGIDLLIARPFSNKRAYVQGKGRVGRNGEPCSRFQLKGLQELVDK